VSPTYYDTATTQVSFIARHGPASRQLACDYLASPSPATTAHTSVLSSIDFLAESRSSSQAGPRSAIDETVGRARVGRCARIQ
jgi:hypothetical protein